MVLASAKWLTFFGLALATVAALLLAFKGSVLYEWLQWAEFNNVFKSLGKVAAKHERLYERTRVSPMLATSEVVIKDLDSRLKGGLVGLAIQRVYWLRAHDRLRRNLSLTPKSVESPAKIVRQKFVEASREEASKALTDSIANTSLAEGRYIKFAVWVFLFGSTMQLFASIPWC
ncbi:hypothetical protein [Mesorhizobium neociceri]|uniref:Uncharacterized protein n=1 Tax=Mesorhizobium neociceri TaxID=1307853 RepID=A0A838BCM4_9HYPH|nr:hypothetical protein [Mesorhizobium neociceri]MBA1143789.1 hypothetical protein [Mesorhizobium neociceri]